MHVNSYHTDGRGGWEEACFFFKPTIQNPIDFSIVNAQNSSGRGEHVSKASNQHLTKL